MSDRQGTRAMIEEVHAGAHEKPEACDLRCLRGGAACERKVCTSACKIAANIEMVEAEKRAEADATPVWRDPAVEMPDDDIAVTVKVEDEEDPIRCAFHEGECWYGVHSGLPLAVRVLGWMDVHEAVQILDAARKEVRHA